MRDQRFAQSASGLLGREIPRATLLLESEPALEGKVRKEVQVRLGAVGPSPGTISSWAQRVQGYYHGPSAPM